MFVGPAAVQVPGALGRAIDRVNASLGIGAPPDIRCLANHARFGGSAPSSVSPDRRRAQPVRVRAMAARIRARERGDELPTDIEENIRTRTPPCP
jgi:hypothetical protein